MENILVLDVLVLWVDDDDVAKWKLFWSEEESFFPPPKHQHKLTSRVLFLLLNGFYYFEWKCASALPIGSHSLMTSTERRKSVLLFFRLEKRNRITLEINQSDDDDEIFTHNFQYFNMYISFESDKVWSFNQLRHVEATYIIIKHPWRPSHS